MVFKAFSRRQFLTHELNGPGIVVHEALDIPADADSNADLAAQADYDEAIEDLEVYLELAPNAPNRAKVEALIELLKSRRWGASSAFQGPFKRAVMKSDRV